MNIPDKSYQLSGTVTGRNAVPLCDAKVTVWWQRMRERTELATGATSDQGTYLVRFNVRDDTPQPLLVTVEVNSHELPAPLVSALTKAQPKLTINLSYVPADQSEWATLMRAIEPQLAGVKLSEIVQNSTHQDLSFLAQEADSDTETMMRVAVASRLESAFQIPAPVFYAFLRQQIPSALPRPLLDASQNFTLIDALVQNVASMIFGLSAQIQTQTLTSAIALDYISQDYTKQIPALVAELQAKNTTDLLHQPYLVGNTTLAQLLTVSGLAQDKQAVFSQALSTNTVSMRNFWRTLGDGKHGFTAAEASSIERTLSLGAFVKNFTPLVQALLQNYSLGQYQTLADLARLSLADWEKLVSQTGAPPGIDPAGNLTSAQVFASVVYTRVTRAYPTAALSSRIVSANLVPQADQQPLVQFFTNNPTLELVKDNITTYLAAQGEKAFTGIKQPASVVTNVRSFQRVLRVAPDADVAQKLLTVGLSSATQIASLGSQQFFVKATAAGLTKPEAKKTYEIAAQRYASVVSTYMQMNRDSLGVWPQAMGSVSALSVVIEPVVQADPTLTTLFGSQDYCATDDCTSVLSPAAYLCDLLMWLRNHPQGSQTALDVLDSRRPDIRHLLLNCPNTDIELPYIDLVVELLADKISPPTDLASPTNPIWKQTSADSTAADLKAAPEYFNQPAFTVLSQASYPQSLPYSTGLDGLRTYLQQWNVPLWQLRQALLPLSGATQAQQLAVAAERFKMSPHAADLVTNANFVPAAVAWNTANPANDLAPVPAFLQAANLTYEQLLELLQSAFVQGGLNLAIQGIDDTCTTSSQSLAPSPLDAGFLDRAHRFLRLWLATGYKMWELDLLLNAAKVGAAQLNAATSIALLAFRQLQDASRLPVNQLLAFYQDIDTAQHRDPDGTTTISLYAQVFLNPTVTWIAPDADMVSVATGSPLLDSVLSDHLPAIQPALGVSGADAAALIALTDNQLTLDNLSLMYRVNLLAAAAKSSVANLISIAQLLDPGAANANAALLPLFNSPADTLAFLQQAIAIRASGLSLDALTYLLTPPSSAFVGGWPTTTQMTQNNIATALAAVRTAVVNVLSAGTTLTAAIDGVQTIITVASGSAFPPPAFSVAIGSEILQVTAVSGVGNNTWTVVRGQQSTTAAPAASGAAVAPTGADVTGAAISAVAANAHPATATGLANDVSAFILNTFEAPNTAATLLSFLVDPAFTNSTVAITVAAFPNQFLALQFFDKVAVLARALRLVASDLIFLVSNASVYGGLDFTQLPVTTSQTPLSVPPLLTTLLLVKLARLWTAAPPSSPFQSLYDVIGAVGSGTLSDVASTQLALATITGFPLTDLQAFAPALGLTFPAGYTRPASYDALRTLEGMSRAVTASGAGLATPSTTLAAPMGSTDPIITVTSDIGFPAPGFYVQIGAETLLVTSVGGTGNTSWSVTRAQQGTTSTTAAAGAPVTQTLSAQIVSWAAVPPDETTAQNLAASALGALKAQQPSNDAWLALAPTLMNPIRENRTAALQAYLTSQRDTTGNLIYPDTDHLFDYFLIDVQMSSCQATSRVVQAYIAVQIFVARCRMNMEAPAVVVDLTLDDTWSQWEWMSRYRIWEANREVFLYPENWLIESQRPNRTEIYQTFEQEVRQNQSTVDYLETVVLNYIDRLDGLAHLFVTGTCEDPQTGTIYVVARTHADPPAFYLRSFENGAWTGWAKIPLDIHAHHAIPSVYRGRVCLFWIDVKVANEPHQNLPGVQATGNPPSQDVERYVALGVYFSIYRNGNWAPAQTTKGKLFDKPILNTNSVSNSRAVEALYTLKVQTAPVAPGFGSGLWVDVFRYGDYDATMESVAQSFEIVADQYLADAAAANTTADQAARDQQIATAFEQSAQQLESTAVSQRAVHVGRAVFDGRFSDLEQNDLPIAVYGTVEHLLEWSQATYGLDAQTLLPLSAPDPDLTGEPFLLPQAGALITGPANVPAGYYQIAPLNFTSTGALEQNVGPLLTNCMLPFRVVGPDSDLNFDPASYFFFQDTRRSYWVEAQKYYQMGSAWTPAPPSDPGSAPFQVSYTFHPFYHAFTRLFWNQLGAGGFDLLYDPNLQQNPDRIDPSGSDVFSFAGWYVPTARTTWDHDDVTNQDRQYLDFNYNTPFSVYNWELFYHIPLYVAQLLSQNQQFADSQKWFQYIFNPQRLSNDPIPGRFWIPKPLHNLTGAGILAQQINQILTQVNLGNPVYVAQVENWQQNPFNPFLLADLRAGVPYMKSTVMSYLDNLVAWGDNLFATESREALSEATLLYVIANEILGPAPIAITPPPTADESFDQLEPSLDAFANAMVNIENVIGGAGGGSGSGNGGQTLPGPQTFYFKIPSNPKLLGYWDTVADRLYKLRHCQNIAGAPLQLALFDAPIDPGLLIAAQAAGVDLSSVLSDITTSLPNYRFTFLYGQALDFVNAVRAYGAALQAALEKSDAGALALLQQTLQKQLLADGDDVLDLQVDQAQSNVDALNENLTLGNQRLTYFTSQQPNVINAEEMNALVLSGASVIMNSSIATAETLAAGESALPFFTFGAAGFGGTPSSDAGEGGKNAADAARSGAAAIKAIADAMDKGAAILNALGKFSHTSDDLGERITETKIDIEHTNRQIAGAQIALQIAQRNRDLHQEQVDNIQKQIGFLNDKFTNNSLYDWMVATLSTTYFQSYQLAYQMCKQVEHCYRFELGIQNSSFIQFGYWDSLYKGLLAGETLNHDLRRMQASFLQQNARRYELSRFVSLGVLDPTALQALLVNGWCDFDLPEALFDNDYPGHYNRRLTRVSMTVVYPSPGRFDNIKATLTLASNKVRISTQAQADGSDYAESPIGSDPRFLYNYGAVPQKIAMGNAQDDPGLFITAIANNIVDTRYLPFENAGAVSSWHLEMDQINNEVDLSTVGDVMLHLYYTALDGGANLATAAKANNAANQPTSGVKIFSAQNDFTAAAPTVDIPYPLTPFQALVASQKSLFNATAVPTDGTPRWEAFNNVAVGNVDQALTLNIQPTKFPPWTRGKILTVNSITVVVVAWEPGAFVVSPQAPLPTATLTTSPATGSTVPNVCSATITTPPGTPLGNWSFKIRQASAADFHSLTKNLIGDVFLLVNYAAS